MCTTSSAKLMSGGFARLFHAAFSTLSEAAIAVDREDKIVGSNEAFAALFGFSKSELADLSLDQLCLDAAAEDRTMSPSVSSLPATAKQEGPATAKQEGPATAKQEGPAAAKQEGVRHRYRRRDGTIFWGERSDAPIHDDEGASLGAFSIIRDVTEHAMLDRGLASLLAPTTMGTHNVDQDLSTLIDLGCRYFGVGYGELGRIEGDSIIVEVVGGSVDLHQVGQKLPLRDTFSSIPSDRDGLLTIDPGRVADHPYGLGTGLNFFVASDVRVAGQVYGLLSFADRSSRKRPSIHGRFFLRILARWIGLLLEGRLARSGQSVAIQDLARFAYIASHDLQEPLRRVVTYCQILMEDFGAEVSDEAAEVIEIIQSGGKSMRLMLNDLLVYSRLNQQLEQPFEPVDMASILCHASDDLADRLEMSGAQIKTAHLPLVWGRAPLLQMVCYHLLSNAIKYAGDQTPSIGISIQDQGRLWQFAITDCGIGIEPRFADRIFDIFQRLHPKDDYSGSGAGLAICKLIIERHGGAIWLDTTYDAGARFQFTLPKDRRAAISAITPLIGLPSNA